jgi:cyclomaltodextrinase / maltogenic alpha-amylase / neopullulanase
LKSLLFATSILITVISESVAHAESFLGPVPVQFVSAGTTATLDLHRFYQPSKESTFSSEGAEALQVSYDREHLQLQVRIENAANGLIELPFAIKEGKETKNSVVTFAVRRPDRHEFVYRPTAKVKSVAVAGSFNGWDKEANPLRADATGVFRGAVTLEAGSYSYKFVVDGEWQSDKENPLQESDGFGGNNSLLKIDKSNQGNDHRLSIYLDHMSKEMLLVRATGPGQIKQVSAVAELPNGAGQPLVGRIQDNAVRIALTDLQAGTWVRVIAADAEGDVSNVVRYRLGRQSFQWQDGIIYYALTDRFRNGDKSNDRPVDNPNVKPPANYHGGDWRGIEEEIKAGYFQDLGVNTVWIAPLNKNPATAYQEYPEPHRWYTGYHGYWPISATEVEPHFGNAKSLKSLIQTAHASGLKVIADLVLHHVHEQHPWWREHRDWFGTLALPDGTKNLRRWDDYQFTTWFEPYMPTFNFTNQDAVKALIDNSAWWANEYQLDGFRLDAVKHIPPDFWWRFRSSLRQMVEAKHHQPLYLVGETFKDRVGIDSFVGPNMLDGQFDFPLYDSIKDCFGEGKVGLDLLEASLTASEEAFGKEALMSPLIGNHDKGRFMAYADGDLPDPKGSKDEEVGWVSPPAVDDPVNYRKIELAQAFLFAIDGVPMIYYGDEFGMTGAGDPDNRRDMRFGEALSGAEKEVLDNFKKLARIRSQHPALRCGSRRSLAVEKEMLAFVRVEFEDRVLCIFNRSRTPLERQFTVGPELADGSYQEALSGAVMMVKDGVITVKIGPSSAAFLTARPSATR